MESREIKNLGLEAETQELVRDLFRQRRREDYQRLLYYLAEPDVPVVFPSGIGWCPVSAAISAFLGQPPSFFDDPLKRSRLIAGKLSEEEIAHRLIADLINAQAYDGMGAHGRWHSIHEDLYTTYGFREVPFRVREEIPPEVAGGEPIEFFFSGRMDFLLVIPNTPFYARPQVENYWGLVDLLRKIPGGGHLLLFEFKTKNASRMAEDTGVSETHAMQVGIYRSLLRKHIPTAWNLRTFVVYYPRDTHGQYRIYEMQEPGLEDELVLVSRVRLIAKAWKIMLNTNLKIREHMFSGRDVYKALILLDFYRSHRDDFIFRNTDEFVKELEAKTGISRTKSWFVLFMIWAQSVEANPGKYDTILTNLWKVYGDMVHRKMAQELTGWYRDNAWKCQKFCDFNRLVGYKYGGDSLHSGELASDRAGYHAHGNSSNQKEVGGEDLSGFQIP